MTTMPIMNPFCLKLIQTIFLICLVLQADLVCSKEVIRCMQSERLALLQFKAGLTDPYDMLSSWMASTDCCQWKGVGCSNLTDHVLMLDLHVEYNDSYDYDYDYDYNYYIGNKFYISGDIHKSLMELQQLRYLNFSGNYFDNTNIPGFFGSLKNLRYLDLSNCNFVGQIPIQFEYLSHLKYLNLSRNYLAGLIPHQLGNLSNLQFLILNNNRLEGSIPSQLGNLSNLQFLDLSKNGLDGSIPSHLGNLSNLQYLGLLETSLKGKIPSQLGKLTKLQELYLGTTDDDSALTMDNNDHSGGQWLSNLTSLTHLQLLSISNLDKFNSWLQMLGKLPKLRELSLKSCSLSDHFIHSLSHSKFNFPTSLFVLDLSLNNFASFMIFQWVSNMSSSLVELDLSGNLMGELPSKHLSTKMISRLPKLRELRLSDNKLTSFMIFQCVSNISPNLVELDLSGNKMMDLHSNNFSNRLLKLRQLRLSHNMFTSFMIFQWVSNISPNIVELDLCWNQMVDPRSNQLATTMINRLPKLRELRLSNNKFKSFMIFQWVSNISFNLVELDLSYNLLKASHSNGFGTVMKSLEVLDLSNNRLNGEVFESFMNLCSLHILDISENNFTKDLQLVIQNLSSGCVRNSLQELNLYFNGITGTLPDLSIFTSLKKLDLSDNQLTGKIPEGSSLPFHLEQLALRSNSLEGIIPKSFWMNACKLKSLVLSNNSFSGELQVIIHQLSKCARYPLQQLDLSMNQINGTLPDLSIFSFLEIFDISKNRLNGKIFEDIRFPTKLRTLRMHSNSLSGVISDFHFSGMSMLAELDLSYNLLALRFAEKWVPPFQLRIIGLGSCKHGPTFPKWIQTQKYLEDLDISNAGISDNVPKWFWARLSSPFCRTINISYNNFKGLIPNLQVKNHCSILSLSSNEFEGSIPPFLRGSGFIDLSKNKFSDSRRFLCASGIDEMLAQFDVSINQLSRRIPNCWRNFNSLAYVDLSHNYFSGKIPISMGSLVKLQALLLGNNSLTEEIPFSLMNCTKLVMLDLRENRLQGLIPYWIGSTLKKLQVLSLQRNHFFGSLPLELCHLKSIQLFDLSFNNLSGRIPKCIQNLTSMTQKALSQGFSHHSYTNRDGSTKNYELSEYLTWKGVEQVFNNKVLFLLKSIDLSSNHFSEEIPPEIENLIHLVSLNLSRNNFTGKIPSNIGKLTSLDFLDLSRNKLLGSIPSSLSQIDRLSVLDLSHNQLSGEIPMSTQLQSFNASCYEDNLDLCGPPLAKLCDQGKPTHEAKVKIQDEDLLLHRGFYISLTFGFIIGFWGVFGSILIKRSWRHAYFKFMNNLVDTIYVKCRWGLKG